MRNPTIPARIAAGLVTALAVLVLLGGAHLTFSGDNSDAPPHPTITRQETP